MFFVNYVFLVVCLLRITLSIPESWNREATYPGNLQLGGLFPIHGKNKDGLCSNEITVDGIVALEAFLYSLDKVNEMLETDAGFKLGALSLDTCGSEKHAPAKALKFVFKDYLRKEYKQTSNGSATGEVIGVVGPLISTVTIALANLFGLFNLPQISYAATSPTLSNKQTFPYFLRTVPSDSNQAKALVEILKYGHAVVSLTYAEFTGIMQRLPLLSHVTPNVVCSWRLLYAVAVVVLPENVLFYVFRFWNWTYVAGVYEDSNYGTRGFREFEKLAEQNDICFADKWKIELERHLDQTDYCDKLRHLRSLNARIVVLYMQTDIATQIFSAALAENMANYFVWIGTDGWGNRHIPKTFNEILHGAIISIPVVKNVPDFNEYFYELKPTKNKRNPWFREFWEFVFNCTLSSLDNGGKHRCNETDNLRDYVGQSEFGFMHFTRNAVYAFGHALLSMHKEYCHEKGLCNELKKQLENPEAMPLLNYLKSSSFEGLDGSEVRFVNGRDGLPIYSINAYQRINDSVYAWVNAATFSYVDSNASIEQTNAVNENRAFYASFTQQCNTICPAGHTRRYRVFENQCCWTCDVCSFPQRKFNETHCVPCATSVQTRPPFYQPSDDRDSCVELTPSFVDFRHPFVCIFVSCSLLGLFFVVAVITTFVRYSDTPVVKASSRELSVLLLLGITVCYTTVFLIVLEPNRYVCAFSRFLYSLGYTVSYASIFVKTNRIARIFGSRCPKLLTKKTRYVSPVSQIFMVACFVGFQMVLNTVWLILRPPSVGYNVDLDYDDEIVVVNKFCEAFIDSSLLIGLIFPIFLLVLSSIYAFKTRKTPGKFNETKFIVITNYSTCIVWLAFVPVFFSTEKIQLRIYSLCAALIMNATVTLFCLFIPKLYMVLCRPHKNTKDSVMGRKANETWNNYSPSKSELNLTVPLIGNEFGKNYRHGSYSGTLFSFRQSKDEKNCDCVCHINGKVEKILLEQKKRRNSV